MKRRYAFLPAAIGSSTAAAALVGAAPPAQRSAISEYDRRVAVAKAAATGVAARLIGLCALPTGGERRPPAFGRERQLIAPQRVFDQLYYVGLANLSAWVIDTGDGLVLIDALNNAGEANEVIVTGMQRLGLDPAKLRYIVVSHGHGDHYGGAATLATRFGARVIASDVDWKLMASPARMNNPAWSPPPARDMTVTDGQTLRVGRTAITFYVTPGHTPGTLSLIFGVNQGAKRHVAAFWGGTAFNFAPTAANFATYAASAKRFGRIAEQAGADVILSNHPTYDNTVANLAILRDGKPADANPYVVGRQATGNFFTVASECAQARQTATQGNEP